MPLLSRIKDDLNTARKAKDRIDIRVLTTLYAEAAKEGKDKGNRESTDTEVIKVVTTFIKNAKEMLGHLEDEDDKAVFEDEIETYQTYLPPQMSKEELTSVIINIMEVKEGDVTPTIGVVMKHLSANYSGKYDGKLASEIVRAYKQTNN